MNQPKPPPADRSVAAITGAGRGIGTAIAWELAGRGFDLALMGRDETALNRVAADIRAAHASPRVEPFRCDVSDGDSVAAAFASAGASLGGLTALVNNAGRALSTAFMDLTAAQWDELLDINVKGAWRCIREVLPGMMARHGGRIVNVASTAGLKGYPRVVAYVASKHALVGLTRSLAIEMGRHGITVNAVCPGYTDTDITRRAIDDIARATGRSEAEALDLLTRPMGLGRLIQPDEVARVVGWLCSDEAASTTGQVLAVAGTEVI